METAEFFFGLVGAFVLLLVFSKHLMRAVRYLVAEDADIAVFSGTNVTHDPASVVATDSNPALTATRDVPVSLFTSQRVTTAEIVPPASVTEQTINLLENK